MVYADISEYGVIGDGRTAALISREGSLDWLCLPDFDSPAIFAAILDHYSGGRFQIRPAASARSTRRYLEKSNVLETRHETAEGVFTVTDFMPLMVGGIEGRLEPEREVVRLIRVEEGEAEIEVIFEPRPRFASTTAHVVRRGALGWFCSFGADLFSFRSDFDLERSDELSLRGTCRLKAGERRHFSLCFARGDIAVVPTLGPESEEKLQRTLSWWRSWISRCEYCGPFGDQVIRSLLALRLLTFNQSGAVVAAVTSSLPEAIGGMRNWDYRYCWLRDSSFILRSFLDLGYREEGEAFLDWLLHATRRTAPELHNLYTLYGQSSLKERAVLSLEGYRGSAPVRIGNRADVQLQLDVYGAVAMTAHDFVRRGGRLDWSARRLLTRIGDQVCAVWRRPDNGIWEYRRGRRHNTYSKLLCWVALDRLLALESEGVLKLDRKRLERDRGMLRRAIETHAWSEKLDAYSGAFGRDYLDASLLLIPRVGFHAPSDPRMVKTFERIEERLTVNGLTRRYEHGVDQFPSPEGAFIACTFWSAEYLARRGEPERARARVEQVLELSSDLGLLPEELDPKDGGYLGNFPQAFSHTGLVNAALAIEQAERARGERSGQ